MNRRIHAQLEVSTFRVTLTLTLDTSGGGRIWLSPICTRIQFQFVFLPPQLGTAYVFKLYLCTIKALQAPVKNVKTDLKGPSNMGFVDSFLYLLVAYLVVAPEEANCFIGDGVDMATPFHVTLDVDTIR